MSNSCRPLLKSYLQCIRNTDCFLNDPSDEAISRCVEDPAVQETCNDQYRIYTECRLNMLNPNSRMRGNTALRRSRNDGYDGSS